MIKFTHFGKIGDLLQSLYFCKEFTNTIGDKKYNYFMTTQDVE